VGFAKKEGGESSHTMREDPAKGDQEGEKNPEAQDTTSPERIPNFRQGVVT
jgi:hypothetical protein